MLEAVLCELLTSNADIIVKARAAAQLFLVGVKIIELTDINARIEQLEQALDESRG